jgi:hypothetical protein
MTLLRLNWLTTFQHVGSACPFLIQLINTNNSATWGFNRSSGTLHIWHLLSSGMLCSVDWWLRIDVSGQPIGPIFKGQTVQIAWTLNMEPIRCPETWGIIYWSTLRNIIERAKVLFTPRRQPDVTPYVFIIMGESIKKRSYGGHVTSTMDINLLKTKRNLLYTV